MVGLLVSIGYPYSATASSSSRISCTCGLKWGEIDELARCWAVWFGLFISFTCRFFGLADDSVVVMYLRCSFSVSPCVSEET